MRVAVAVFLLPAVAVTLAALAAEDEAAADPEPAAEPETTADTKPTWEAWLSANAYDPIRRCWVAIPEDVEPGPKTGYIWNLGRWEVVKIVQRKGYGWGYFDHRGEWHGQAEDRAVYRTVLWKRRHYEETLPRRSFEGPDVAKEIQLEPAECARIENLLERRIIQELLLEDSQDKSDGRAPPPRTPQGRATHPRRTTCSSGTAVVDYDPDTRAVRLGGRAELVATIATLITDESTYKAYATEQPHGNVVAIISLVDLAWLDREPEAALTIADLNLAGLERLVRARSDQYRRLSKALWFNDTYGTVTIIDQPDTIDTIREYLATTPYGPKPKRMTSVPVN